MLDERPIERNMIDIWLLNEPASIDPSPTLSTMLLHGIILRATKFCTKKDVLRVLSIVKSKSDVKQEIDNLSELLLRYRIQAKVDAFSVEDYLIRNPHSNMEDCKVFNEIIKENAVHSSTFYLKKIKKKFTYKKILTNYIELVFVPLPSPPFPERDHEGYIDELEELTSDLPPTLMVSGTTNVLTNEL